MKKPLIVLLLTVIFISGFSQSKSLLTKEETINYINKKVKEAIGLATYPNFIISEMKFQKLYSDDNVVMTYKTEGNPQYTVEFNPGHIKEVKDKTPAPNDIVGEIEIKLIGKTSKISYDGRKGTGDETFLYYLKSDPANYNRISNALLHLRDLYKAEGDPFDN